MSNKMIDYLKECYERSEMREIVRQGCVSGAAHSHVYYSETVKFHDEFEEEIWDMLSHEADNLGLTVLELIFGFNGQKDVGSMAQFKNLLCWYAIESVCLELGGG